MAYTVSDEKLYTLNITALTKIASDEKVKGYSKFTTPNSRSMGQRVKGLAKLIVDHRATVQAAKPADDEEEPASDEEEAADNEEEAADNEEEAADNEEHSAFDALEQKVASNVQQFTTNIQSMTANITALTKRVKEVDDRVEKAVPQLTDRLEKQMKKYVQEYVQECIQEDASTQSMLEMFKSFSNLTIQTFKTMAQRMDNLQAMLPQNIAEDSAMIE